MKTILWCLTLVALAAAVCAAESLERGHGRGGSQRAGVSAAPLAAGRAQAGSVIMKMHRVTVPRQPRAFTSPEHIVRDSRRIAPPSRDDQGRPVTQRRMLPPSQHATVVRNQVVIQNVARLQRVEVEPNRFAWHTVSGVRFCHFYDGGIHWWGFFDGPTFYWTRFWADRWWWYDPGFARWVFWWDGFWWWPGPAGAMHVFLDNGYYPYDSAGVVVRTPALDQPPQAAPATTALGNSHESPDGRRLVQVYGDRSEAFLYDKTGHSPEFLTYLAGGVEKVRFSGGKEGKPLRVLLDFKDGNFALFDDAGRPLDAEESREGEAGLPARPPEAPTAAPPGGGAKPPTTGPPPTAP